MQIYERRSGIQSIEYSCLDNSKCMDKYKIFECIYKREVDKKYKLHDLYSVKSLQGTMFHCTFGFPRMGVVSCKKDIKGDDTILIAEFLSYTPISFSVDNSNSRLNDYRTFSYHTHKKVINNMTTRGIKFEQFKSTPKKIPIHWTLINKISYMKLIAMMN